MDDSADNTTDTVQSKATEDHSVSADKKLEQSFKLYGSYTLRPRGDVLPDIYHKGAYIRPSRQDRGRRYRDPQAIMLKSDYGRMAASNRFDFLFPRYGPDFGPTLRPDGWQSHRYFETNNRAYLGFSRPFKQYLAYGDDVTHTESPSEIWAHPGSNTCRQQRASPREQVQRELCRATALANAGLITQEAYQHYWLSHLEDFVHAKHLDRVNKAMAPKHGVADQIEHHGDRLYSRTGFIPPPPGRRQRPLIERPDIVREGCELYKIGAITPNQLDRYFLSDEWYDIADRKSVV